jgi:hypothetical protein
MEIVHVIKRGTLCATAPSQVRPQSNTLMWGMVLNGI